MTKNSTSHKISKISWAMKIAFALAFAPVCLLILALAFKLPLPAAPCINLFSDNPPEYIFFFTYSAKNIPSSTAFTLICFSFGIGLLSWLALERGSIKQTFKDLVNNLKEDISGFFNNNDESYIKNVKKNAIANPKKTVHKIKLVGKQRITKS